MLTINTIIDEIHSSSVLVIGCDATSDDNRSLVSRLVFLVHRLAVMFLRSWCSISGCVCKILGYLYCSIPIIILIASDVHLMRVNSKTVQLQVKLYSHRG